MVPDVQGLVVVGHAISHTVHSSLFLCLLRFMADELAGGEAGASRI